jgi:hypothetical protein
MILLGHFGQGQRGPSHGVFIRHRKTPSRRAARMGARCLVCLDVFDPLSWAGTEKERP